LSNPKIFVEPPDFVGIDDCCRFDILSNVLEIILPLAPVPDPVPRVIPGINFEEKGDPSLAYCCVGERDEIISHRQ
jgi:hypothetical protein